MDKKGYKFDTDENISRFSQSYINSLKLFLDNDSYKHKVEKMPQISCLMISKKNDKKTNKDSNITKKALRSTSSNLRGLSIFLLTYLFEI